MTTTRSLGEVTGHTVRVGPAAAPAATTARPAADQEPMLVTHVGDDRFTIQIRGHGIVVDQPEERGGDDEGPTPTELFVASVASAPEGPAAPGGRRGRTTDQAKVPCSSHGGCPPPADSRYVRCRRHGAGRPCRNHSRRRVSCGSTT